MTDRDDWPARWVREQLGHEPRDTRLFVAALTHRSAPGPDYERLEFLGDAVLNLVIARYLYVAFADGSEGDLSRLRARVVSSEPLAEVAAQIGLGAELQLGAGELKTGGYRRRSILADAFEAVCGALFLDGGLPAADAAIHRLFEPRIAALPDPATLKDAKTRLQEYLQSRGLALPRYTLSRTEGEAHEQIFHVSCEIAGLSLSAAGSGSTRRRAEQQAAERILQQLGSQAT